MKNFLLVIAAAIIVALITQIVVPHFKGLLITTEQIEQEELQEYEEERIDVGSDIADQLENDDYVLPVE